MVDNFPLRFHRVGEAVAAVVRLVGGCQRRPSEGGSVTMANGNRLGELERRIMEHLWNSPHPQTVREVHQSLLLDRALAYNTIMTVLRRLAAKGLVVQHRCRRAHRYAAAQRRDELVAELMLDALEHAANSGDRLAALVHFAESVGAEDIEALKYALSEVNCRHGSR